MLKSRAHQARFSCIFASKGRGRNPFLPIPPKSPNPPLSSQESQAPFPSSPPNLKKISQQKLAFLDKFCYLWPKKHSDTMVGKQLVSPYFVVTYWFTVSYVIGGGKSQSRTSTLIYDALCSRTGCKPPISLFSFKRHDAARLRTWRRLAMRLLPPGCSAAPMRQASIYESTIN